MDTEFGRSGAEAPSGQSSETEPLGVSAQSVTVPNAVAYNNLPWLHIRGQFSYHCEAYIVGSRAGLTSLRDTINAALADGSAEAEAIANDGEGYAVTVRRTSRLRDMGDPPYIDRLAREIAESEREYLRKVQRHNWCLYQRLKQAHTAAQAGEAGTAETPKSGSARRASTRSRRDAPKGDH